MITAAEFDAKYRARLEKLSTTNIADALDALGLKGHTFGIKPVWEGTRKIVGRAQTLKLIAAGMTPSKYHLGVMSITDAEPGDIIVIDNAGRLDTSCWGGILTKGAQAKGISGIVVDGAVRDVDDIVDFKFSAYAKGAVPHTARGRIMEHSHNEMIQFAGVQVRPGDIVFADRSGVCFIAQEKIEEVTAKAEDLFNKEDAMIKDIEAGMSSLEVDQKYSYEKMLK